MTLRGWVAVLSAALLLASVPVRAEEAGKVLFVHGQAGIEGTGVVQPLVRGGSVSSGDLIVTGTDGRVQLLMQDGERIALRPGTRFRIDEFRPPRSASAPETGRSIYSLLRGGFQAITRSLGRRGLDSYRVNTPVATIGIRGTQYLLRYCTDDCEPAGTGNGLYLGVQAGGLLVQNGRGSLNLDKNEYGYVQDGQSPPRQLPASPAVLQDLMAGPAGDGSVAAPLSIRRSPGSGMSEDGGPASAMPPERAIQSTDPQGGGVDLTPGQLPPPPVQPPDNVIDGGD